MNDGEILLQLDDVNAYYGASHVLQGVSLRVPRGGIVSLMGRNGAGKTTTLKSVVGLVQVRRGGIAFAGESITGLPPHQIARRGIALVPEDRRIFSSLSVAENILLSAGGRSDAIAEAIEWFPALRDYLRRSGDRLSGGEQQMLAIARALVARPQIMLIDEPLEGLAPIIAERIEQALQKLRGRITALVVDQNLKWLMQVAGHHYVMDRGRIVFEGTSDMLRQNPQLIEQYLGIAA
jgi:branched-chain amino acid transport system ATP-binding protein